ncbi:UDP-4-amino-4-deoxy-L-arabinose--oxoglutarate aminotransferase [Cupriavidus sp. U2]|uniref:DegT/DnrJ/EryC1/StrS family aminotransferase n=1 Tax=Cupriavidus sp. U2 TaxID=2920269 RepID=UPI00129D779B|nr:DegT/DnrJ/EryC1/StrS aminotransferase family protein [Cupriavidus sp. U2]KAI3593038.1 UDP-4-amino-4-deoxy-L-arabinose--oxoglutarate aminotransferase [Cupriavidus sp. U2]
MTASAPQDFLPFVRPQIDDATIAEVGKVLASGWITSGPKVQAFEAALSELFGGRPVRTFSNGSATMEIALRIADIGPGDEVITTPITWVATANVVLTVGARPVFVDIDPVTRNIDLDAVEAAITPRTRAIMPVYLSGLPVDMDRLYAIAKRHNLRVIEDAAQAIDSRWRGQRIGAFGDLVSFSFQANKNITTVEGGCLVMNTPEEARRAERLRLQGVIRTGMDGMDVEEPGGKFNLTDVNAAIGLAQLKTLDAITARRAELAETYFRCAAQAGLTDLGIELPLPLDPAVATTNWHMFQVVLPTERLRGGPADARKLVMEAMREQGVGTGVHYPPVHLFTYFRSLGWREGMLPHAERIGRGIVTLPLFPAMQAADVERVCATLSETCKRLSH